MSLNIDKKILSILSENLTNESMWFLYTLRTEDRELHKEELRDLTNEFYLKRAQKKDQSFDEKLISSRYSLDVHTSRLEGAGLVHVRNVGRVRFYSISDLGKKLFEYKTERKSEKND